MKSLILFITLSVASLAMGQVCNEEGLKKAYKDKKKECRSLKGDTKKQCKEAAKSLKKDWKTCKKSMKKNKGGNKYCKKIKRLLKKKYATKEFKQKVNELVELKTCSKSQYQNLKKELKELKKSGEKNKKGDKYCRKLEKLKKKKFVSDLYKEQIDASIKDGNCDKTTYKHFKKRLRKEKKDFKAKQKGGSKYCRKIKKLTKKINDKTLLDEANALVVGDKCTKEDFKKIKCERKGKKQWDPDRKKCIKKKRLATLDNIEFISKTSLKFIQCQAYWKKMKDKNKFGKYLTKRHLKKLIKRGCAWEKK